MFRKPGYFLLLVSFSIFAMEPPEEKEVGALGKRKREEEPFEQQKVTKKETEDHAQKQAEMVNRIKAQGIFNPQTIENLLYLEKVIPKKIALQYPPVQIPTLKEMTTARLLGQQKEMVGNLITQPSLYDLMGQLLKLPTDLQKLIKQKVNQPDELGRTLLHKAKTAQQALNLIFMGAQYKADKWGDAPLHIALKTNNVPVAYIFTKLIATSTANWINKQFETVLMLAASKGYQKIVRELLKKQVSVSNFDQRGFSALILAAGKGHEQIVKDLIKAKADVDAVNQKFWTALMFAVEHGHDQIVKYLIDVGADVNRADYLNQTALMFAAEQGHEQIVKDLIKAKADVDAVNQNGDSALMIAAKNGHEQIVQDLIKAGAHVNAPALLTTPLLLAIQNNHKQVIRVLLEAKTDVNRPALGGITPLGLAIKNADAQLVKDLLNAGAIPTDELLKKARSTLYQSEIAKILEDAMKKK